MLGSRIGTPHEMQLLVGLLGEWCRRAAVHAAVPLAQAPRAHRMVAQREQTGKAILASPDMAAKPDDDVSICAPPLKLDATSTCLVGVDLMRVTGRSSLGTAR